MFESTQFIMMSPGRPEAKKGNLLMKSHTENLSKDTQDTQYEEYPLVSEDEA